MIDALKKISAIGWQFGEIFLGIGILVAAVLGILFLIIISISE